ncbi:hypothetical protein CEXT_414371 [Caerostris extrusa]|uniref:Uncharacterized protein n=1 Tax=Caerostris extrusa TaxID=172846 RepID=A0AAV4NRH0_CAEEX|nr:hypothetical protein CEXT_414371 [Caerostris extrusa]
MQKRAWLAVWVEMYRMWDNLRYIFSKLREIILIFLRHDSLAVNTSPHSQLRKVHEIKSRIKAKLKSVTDFIQKFSARVQDALERSIQFESSTNPLVAFKDGGGKKQPPLCLPHIRNYFNLTFSLPTSMLPSPYVSVIHSELKAEQLAEGVKRPALTV